MINANLVFSPGIIPAFIVSLATCLAANAGDLPDPLHTSGAVDPAVTQNNIQQTICVPGYTKTVRPPASYTNRIKRELLDSYYKDQGDMHSVELDHLIPLTVGGHPTDLKNLWPQSYGSEHDASFKDRCEVAARTAICQGRVALVEAQKGFATNWIEWCKQLTGDTQ